MMRPWSMILLMSFAMCMAAYGQEIQDVLILKDGTRLVGFIETIVPDKSVTLRSSDGTLYVLDWDRIERIEKAPRTPEITPGTPATAPKPYKPGLESWYAYLSLGYAWTSLPAGTRQYIDQFIQPLDPSHVAVAVDFLGFYWPLANERTLIGCVITGAADRYTYTDGLSNSKSIQFNQYLYAASMMHFFGEIPGDGPYLRGELGIAALASELDTESGFGLQVSGGYGIVLSVETRILVQAGFAYRRLDSGDATTWTITIGWLL